MSRYMGPFIDVGPDMTRQILANNNQVLNRTMYHAHRLGAQTMVDDLLCLDMKSMPKYDDESQHEQT